MTNTTTEQKLHTWKVDGIDLVCERCATVRVVGTLDNVCTGTGEVADQSGGVGCAECGVAYSFFFGTQFHKRSCAGTLLRVDA